MNKPLEFLLGANTPQGFVSRFDQLADPADGWREFVIKGGPGTGKSTLMRNIAGALSPYSPHMELIHCSSDVDSLDGVIFHDLKIAIADGTLPHDGRTEAHESIFRAAWNRKAPGPLPARAWREWRPFSGHKARPPHWRSGQNPPPSHK